MTVATVLLAATGAVFAAVTLIFAVAVAVAVPSETV
jgi:hypothetical protein